MFRALLTSAGQHKRSKEYPELLGWSESKARTLQRTAVSTHLGKMLTERATAETDEPRVHVTMVLSNRTTPSLREETTRGRTCHKVCQPDMPMKNPNRTECSTMLFKGSGVHA